MIQKNYLTDFSNGDTFCKQHINMKQNTIQRKIKLFANNISI